MGECPTVPQKRFLEKTKYLESQQQYEGLLSIIAQHKTFSVSIRNICPVIRKYYMSKLSK